MKALFVPILVTSTMTVADTPAFPEPPILFYGTATDGGKNQPVTITAVTWRVTDGTESGTFTLTSAPPTRIVNQSGQSFYMLEVPFETRVIKTAAGQTVTLTRQGQSFELKSPSPTYTLAPFINGRAATIRRVNGAPATGPTVSLANSPQTNGKIMRVDLTLPAATAYETWAAVHFPNPAAPEAARTADPDGDGASNEQEHAAGTDPKNGQSVMIVKAISAIAGGGYAISWDSIAGRSYAIERSADMKVWNPVKNGIPGTGGPISFTDSTPASTGIQFYRIKVLYTP